MPPAPRKIVYLTPSVRMLGARQSLLQLATHLDRARYEPLVVCPRRGDLEERLREAGVATAVLKLPPWRKGKWLFLRPFRTRALIQLLAKERAALIHCNEYHSNPYAILASRALGAPTVTHQRLTVTPRQVRNYKLDRADRLIVVSRAAGADFADFEDLREKLRVVYNGLDFAAFTAGADGAAFRRELGLSGNDLLIGQVGLISDRKQVHVAIEAFGRIAGRFPRLHLALVGGPSPGQEDYLARVREQAAQTPAPERIHFPGFRQDAANVFAALELNLLISSQEGFGRVIIEAGAFGAPSIGARTGGIPEVIDDGETGLLVDCGDAAALAEALAALAGDPERRRTLSENVHRRVRQRFGIETHVREIQNVYEELLD